MAKKQGGGKLLPLPFTTFGEIAALGLKATVYCSRCYQHRPIDPAAEHLRDRCFATTRFRCCVVRYTGDVCGCLGSVAIKPTVLLLVGGDDTLAFLFCVTCEPVGDQPCADRQTAVVGSEPQQQRPLPVPGVREGRGLAHSRAELATLALIIWQHSLRVVQPLRPWSQLKLVAGCAVERPPLPVGGRFDHLSSPAACTRDSEAVGKDGHHESPEHYEEQDGDEYVARHIEGTAKKDAMKVRRSTLF